MLLVHVIVRVLQVEKSPNIKIHVMVLDTMQGKTDLNKKIKSVLFQKSKCGRKVIMEHLTHNYETIAIANVYESILLCLNQFLMQRAMNTMLDKVRFGPFRMGLGPNHLIVRNNTPCQKELCGNYCRQWCTHLLKVAKEEYYTIFHSIGV